MALPNPIYIDSQALHSAQAIRLLAFSAVEGRQGVLDKAHLSVAALPTPSAVIQALPGGYSILGKHLGGDFEAYVGKFSTAEQVAVSPVGSSGPRTDLVIARVENPYVSGAGVWPVPVDPVGGPYAYIRVIEGVPPYTCDVTGYNNTWSAITLARITRPANTGVVAQSDITDLRSIAKLGEERIVVINNPPAIPPPIAQSYWTESTPVDNNNQFLGSSTSWTDFPTQAAWNVPVPSWATGMDVNVLFNPQITGSLWGQMRLSAGGSLGGVIPTEYDVNFPGGPGPARETIMIGGTFSIIPSLRGTVVPVKLQAISNDNSPTHPGRLVCGRGTRINIFLNFKRYPVYSDGS